MGMAFWQFAGSLAAVATLAWLAFRFGFNDVPVLTGEDEARAIADEVPGGFVAEAVVLDASGRGALLRDRAGRVVLVAPWGAHFLSRALSSLSSVAREGGRLTVGDGKLAATLELGAAADDWERAIARLQ